MNSPERESPMMRNKCLQHKACCWWRLSTRVSRILTISTCWCVGGSFALAMGRTLNGGMRQRPLALAQEAVMFSVCLSGCGFAALNPSDFNGCTRQTKQCTSCVHSCTGAHPHAHARCCVSAPFALLAMELCQVRAVGDSIHSVSAYGAAGLLSPLRAQVFLYSSQYLHSNT